MKQKYSDSHRYIAVSFLLIHCLQFIAIPAVKGYGRLKDFTYLGQGLKFKTPVIEKNFETKDVKPIETNLADPLLKTADSGVSQKFDEKVIHIESATLGGGPSQTESQAFASASADNLVNHFTGDFSYNIPLFEIGGYPINLAYQAGVTMEQEASWVGLGWTLNPGSVSRNMRGIPDDFNGDVITKKQYIKPNRTYTVTPGAGAEFFGFGVGLSLGFSYNNYKGIDVSPGLSFGGKKDLGAGSALGFDFSATSSGQNGLNVTPNLSFSKLMSETSAGGGQQQNRLGLSLSSSFNSRTGLSQMSYGLTASANATKGAGVNRKGASGSTTQSGSTIQFGHPTYSPLPEMAFQDFMASGSVKLGGEFTGAYPNYSISLSYSTQYLLRNENSRPAFGTCYLDSAVRGKRNEETTITLNEKAILDFNKEKDQGLSAETPNMPLAFPTQDQFNLNTQTFSCTFKPNRGKFFVFFDPEVESDNIPPVNLSAEIGVGNLAETGGAYSSGYTMTRSGVYDDRLARTNIISKLLPQSGLNRSPFSLKVEGEYTNFLNSSKKNTLKILSDYFDSENPTRMSVKFSGVLTDQEDVMRLASFEPPYEAGFRPKFLTKPSSGDVPPELAQKPTETVLKSAIANLSEEISSNVNYFTAQEAAYIPWVKKQRYFTSSPLISSLNSSEVPHLQYNGLNRSQYQKPHHIAGFWATDTKGMTYRFGIPVYSIYQDEYSMTINSGDGNPSTRLANVDARFTDDSKFKEIGKGQNGYFQKNSTPAYATSYLLSEVLSPDYEDIKGDGCTIDDYGNYVKFSYLKWRDDYMWRTPNNPNSTLPQPEKNQGSYNAGLRNNKGNYNSDDQATVICGKKEIWYTSAIESKTQIAIFTVNPIAGGGRFNKSVNPNGSFVQNTDGSNVALGVLSSIKIYAKPIDGTRLLETMTPIRTIMFSYDYSLCKDLSGSGTNTGKLTLKEVKFLGENSRKGEKSHYSFSYGELYKKDNLTKDLVVNDLNGINMIDNALPYNLNPNYNPNNVNRWGGYQSQYESQNGTSVDYCSNSDNPYVLAIPLSTTNVENGPISSSNSGKLPPGFTIADLNAYVWNLTRIDLPEGGSIVIDYEADDYAYVQDERAGTMVKVKGFSQGESDTPTDKLYYPNGGNAKIVWIELSDAIKQLMPCTTVGLTGPALNVCRNNWIVKHFLTDKNGKVMSQIYFKANVRIKPGSEFEYVSGYASINSEVLYVRDNDNLIGFQINEVEMPASGTGPTTSINPIALAGFNFTKLNLQWMAYNLPTLEENNIVAVGKSLAASASNISDIFQGFNTRLRLDQFCREVDLKNTYIRIFQPDGFKHSGTHRVRRIRKFDNWQKADLSSSKKEFGEVFSQVYEYSTKDQWGNTISSGVAASEPGVGGDESTLKKPEAYSTKHMLVPKSDFYQEGPFGEALFPSYTVGYSKVTVKDELLDDAISFKNRGKLEFQFYTAKDFPVVTSKTPLERDQSRINNVNPLWSTSFQGIYANQGYVIELNDMHGKPKANYVYAEGQSSPMSGVEYLYKVKNGRLDNGVTTINPDLSISSQTSNMEIGVDREWALYLKEETVTAYQFSGDVNLNAFTVFLPLFVFSIIPKVSESRTRFNYSGFTKLVYRYGLVDKVRSFDVGNEVVTRNLAYNSTNGEVILTEYNNNFKDNLYSFKLPASWVYKDLEKANICEGQRPNVSSITNLQKAADILFYEAKPSGSSGEVNHSPVIIHSRKASGLALTDAAGTTWYETETSEFIGSETNVDLSSALYTNGYKKRLVLRSHAKNMLEATVQDLVLSASPIHNDQGRLLSKVNIDGKVLSATAALYGPDRCEANDKAGNFINTISYSRPKATYFYRASRSQSSKNRNTNIRKDGFFTDFKPFWDLDSRNIYRTNFDGWILADSVQLYSCDGISLQTIDKTGRQTAQLFKSNRQYKYVEAVDASVRDILVEDFEGEVAPFHEREKVLRLVSIAARNEENSNTSHTGRYALRLTSNQSRKTDFDLDPCPSGNCDEYGNGGDGKGGPGGNPGNPDNPGNPNKPIRPLDPKLPLPPPPIPPSGPDTRPCVFDASIIKRCSDGMLIIRVTSTGNCASAETCEISYLTENSTVSLGSMNVNGVVTDLESGPINLGDATPSLIRITCGQQTIYLDVPETCEN